MTQRTVTEWNVTEWNVTEIRLDWITRQPVRHKPFRVLYYSQNHKKTFNPKAKNLNP